MNVRLNVEQCGQTVLICRCKRTPHEPTTWQLLNPKCIFPSLFIVHTLRQNHTLWVIKREALSVQSTGAHLSSGINEGSWPYHLFCIFQCHADVFVAAGDVALRPAVNVLCGMCCTHPACPASVMIIIISVLSVLCLKACTPESVLTWTRRCTATRNSFYFAFAEEKV